MIDILILGQGLAGTSLAINAISEGKTVMVIDNGHQSAASMVAAGLVTPVTESVLH